MSLGKKKNMLNLFEISQWEVEEAFYRMSKFCRLQKLLHFKVSDFGRISYKKFEKFKMFYTKTILCLDGAIERVRNQNHIHIYIYSWAGKSYFLLEISSSEWPMIRRGLLSIFSNLTPPMNRYQKSDSFISSRYESNHKSHMKR